MYELSVTVHVLAAVIGFGATFTYPIILLAAERAGPAAVPTGLSTILLISRSVAVPATLLVGATGIYQLASGPFDLGDAWLLAGLILYLLVMAVATLLVAPAYERARREATEMVEEGREPSASSRYGAAMRVVNRVGPALAASIVAIVALMELKPG